MKPCPFPTDPLKTLINALAFPLRTVFLKEEWVEKIGLDSLQQERIRAVWPYLEGRLLDIGAGNNRLVQLYGDGIGVDVHHIGKEVLIVEDTAHLPFESESFDTVSFLACLNHIPKRAEVLTEARRLLRSQGRCIVTMINPVIGFINHKLCWYEESHKRGMAEGERDGLWKRDVIKLFQNAGFKLQKEIPFLYGLNKTYVAYKEN